VTGAGAGRMPWSGAGCGDVSRVFIIQFFGEMLAGRVGQMLSYPKNSLKFFWGCGAGILQEVTEETER